MVGFVTCRFSIAVNDVEWVFSFVRRGTVQKYKLFSRREQMTRRVEQLTQQTRDDKNMMVKPVSKKSEVPRATGGRFPHVSNHNRKWYLGA